MAETYTGGCHCGRVRYEVESDFKPVVNCNCSICTKRGALWTFAKAAQFKLLKGDDAFSDYQFGKKRIHHLFCADCGIGSFARGQAPDGADTYAINVRCLDNVDVDKLQLTPFDGKSL
jgi:hypothetical protein